MEFRAASLADYAALFPARPFRVWQVAAVQILSGPAWTLWRGGRPRLICGLYPLEHQVLEAWLMMPAGLGAERATLRFLLTAATSFFPHKTIIARIDDANHAGQRMAAIAGFIPFDEWLPGTTKRTWLTNALWRSRPWLQHRRKRDT